MRLSIQRFRFQRFSGAVSLLPLRAPVKESAAWVGIRENPRNPR